MCAQRTQLARLFNELVSQTIAESGVPFALLMSCTLSLTSTSSTSPPQPALAFHPLADLS